MTATAKNLPDGQLWILKSVSGHPRSTGSSWVGTSQVAREALCAKGLIEQVAGGLLGPRRVIPAGQRKHLKRSRYTITELGQNVLMGAKFTKALEVETREEGVERHPSYGVVTITRPSGSTNLFGSELTHQHFMTLSVSRASRRRDLQRDWIHGDCAPLIEIHLSEVQWARMVSSAGHGEGTPCTIDHVLGNDQGRPPDQNRLHLLSEEAKRASKSATEMMAALVKQLEEKAAGKPPTKAALKELVHSAECTARNIGPNLDFAVKSAQEAVETVVETGKAEIEAFIDHQARKLGMDQLQGAPSLLLSAPKREKAVNAPAPLTGYPDGD